MPGFVSDRGALERLGVSSISTDTRSLRCGDLFIAIPGERHDGHVFIGDAIRAGASGVVFDIRRYEQVSTFIKANPEILFIGVAGTRKILGSMAANYLGRFSLTRFVLTGSAGKTTTKTLIHSVLSQRYRVVSSTKSFNNDIGVPKTVLNVDEKTEILVQEMGTNHPGEIEKLVGIVRPDCALITNIGPAHIEFFGSEKRIAREKKQVYSALDPVGTAFFNRDDRFYHFLKRGIAAKHKTYGIGCGDLSPDHIETMALEFSEFKLLGKRIRARVLGLHGVLNATAAALVGVHFGLAVEEIARGIESFEGESGRGRVYRSGGITVIDETYNANPLSVAASLSYLGNLSASGRKVFVFADMLELGNKSGRYHRKIACDIADNGIDLVYTFGQRAAETTEGCRSLGLSDAAHFDEIEELRESLRGELRSGDLVLVKGSRAMQLERVIRDFM
jgi:UDP-N-acetylmuramoyl-tripeptide--D-alanyl-D-alanine ligase